MAYLDTFQCGTYNDPRDERCPRCKQWKSSPRTGTGDGQPSSRDRRSMSTGDGPPSSRNRRSFDDQDRHRNNDRKRDGDVDGHYGPPSRGGDRRGRESDDYDDDDRPHKKSREDTPAPKKPQWPPPFESAGASFLFDARSGMFYEPSSDFFYDPKTKLYYSNKEQRYFRYDADKKPDAFQPIGDENGASGQGLMGGQGGEGSTSPVGETAAEVSPGPNVIETKPEKVELKPKIAISLKTTVSPKDGGRKSLNELTAMEKTKRKEKTIRRKESLSAVENNAANPALTQPHKKHAKDMDKWSDRIKEMRGGDPTNDAAPASEKVKTTASGQPICALCRRKFATLEKLQQHEKLSPLHKENLAKKAATDAVAAAAANDAAKQRQESETSYRDRSKERRLMHHGSHVNPDSSHAEALLAHTLNSSSAETKPTEVIRPEETLNDANVGNQMLQKLGWKSGETLGRNNGAQQDGTGGNKDDVASNLKSDWERIELLARRGGRR